MSIQRLAAYGRGSLETWEAVQEAKKKYPGVTRFTIDHSGIRAVARPARLSAVELQQERLARRLHEIAQQEQAYLGSRLRVIGSQKGRVKRPDPTALAMR